MGEILRVRGPPCTRGYLYGQTFLRHHLMWWAQCECREMGCPHPWGTLHFLLLGLFQSNGDQAPLDGSGSPPSCLSDALESTMRVKSMTPLTGATVDDPVPVMTNSTSADPISLSALISSSWYVPEPVRKTHILLPGSSGGPMQSSGQGRP